MNSLFFTAAAFGVALAGFALVPRKDKSFAFYSFFCIAAALSAVELFVWSCWV